MGTLMIQLSYNHPQCEKETNLTKIYTYYYSNLLMHVSTLFALFFCTLPHMVSAVSSADDSASCFETLLCLRYSSFLYVLHSCMFKVYAPTWLIWNDELREETPVVEWQLLHDNQQQIVSVLKLLLSKNNFFLNACAAGLRNDIPIKYKQSRTM